MLPESVLAVCAANVCRSPVISFLMAREFSTFGAPDDSVFASAGASARGGVAVCHTMRSRLAERPGWSDFAEGYRSARLMPEHIESAQLILTATAAERGAVALLNPAARTRTFTLLEAAALAEHARSTRAAATAFDLATLAELMNAHRGLVDPPRSSRWRPAAREAGFDIPDAHTSRARHERVLRTIEVASSRLGAAVRGLTTAP
ncbi:protein-tyrosine phosphatase [Microbacterium foliorum]|uniref:Protein-tyrosine phosphatase n=1 Tax=Microbacterium foliorum TaxID=104336 RepID=A0ABU1HVA4_9MICO|nr:protein tyrosine phosphatase [Microbacterium foliorum]MDR6143983.1 protein-tyrosine phosphatase [Microbacterium foliorum]